MADLINRLNTHIQTLQNDCDVLEAAKQDSCKVEVEKFVNEACGKMPGVYEECKVVTERNAKKFIEALKTAPNAGVVEIAIKGLQKTGTTVAASYASMAPPSAPTSTPPPPTPAAASAVPASPAPITSGERQMGIITFSLGTSSGFERPEIAVAAQEDNTTSAAFSCGDPDSPTACGNKEDQSKKDIASSTYFLPRIHGAVDLNRGPIFAGLTLSYFWGQSSTESSKAQGADPQAIKIGDLAIVGVHLGGQTFFGNHLLFRAQIEEEWAFVVNGYIDRGPALNPNEHKMVNTNFKLSIGKDYGAIIPSAFIGLRTSFGNGRGIRLNTDTIGGNDYNGLGMSTQIFGGVELIFDPWGINK